MAAGHQAVTSLGELVQEQCAARAELNARQAQSGVKTLEDYFGTSLQVLLRLCRVATPAELPPVYQACADNGKKKIADHNAASSRRHDPPNGPRRPPIRHHRGSSSQGLLTQLESTSGGP
jgi:hypothetical protein